MFLGDVTRPPSLPACFLPSAAKSLNHCSRGHSQSVAINMGLQCDLSPTLLDSRP
jgi:hypothetical protein